MKNNLCMWSWTVYLAGSEKSLDHSATLGNAQVDHTQERVSHVLVANVHQSLHGPLQQLVKSGMLKHQLQLIAALLICHLLSGGPHVGQAVADLSGCGRVLAGEV